MHREVKLSLEERIFNILREDIVRVKPEYASEDIILCPICLCKIDRTEILRGGIEHIIPQNVVKKDQNSMKADVSKNFRTGVTALCRKSRVIKGDGHSSKDGCNGYKGKAYDRLFQNLFDFERHAPFELAHRHGVAILIMAYLAAFQTYGYEYIFQKALDEVRSQFDYPDERKTNLLDQAQYCLKEKSMQIVTNTFGFPFMCIELPHMLRVTFRRCQSSLPPVPKHLKDFGLDKKIWGAIDVSPIL